MYIYRSFLVYIYLYSTKILLSSKTIIACSGFYLSGHIMIITRIIEISWEYKKTVETCLSLDALASFWCTMSIMLLLVLNERRKTISWKHLSVLWEINVKISEIPPSTQGSKRLEIKISFKEPCQCQWLTQKKHNT